MRRKLLSYLCPSCGYETDYKNNMRRHFYNLKEPCPKVIRKVELTDDVKEHVLLNRRYDQDGAQLVVQGGVQSGTQPTVQVVNNINQIINNFNVINNFVSNINPLDKITHLIQYSDMALVPFEEQVERKYEGCVEKLNNDGYKYGYELDIDGIIDIIDEVSQVTSDNMNELNVLYDEKGKKIALYSGEWKSLRVNHAIKHVISIIKSCYTNAYEAFLIRRIKNGTMSQYKKQKSCELLREYYKFLGSNEVLPGVSDDFPTDDIASLDDGVREEFNELYKKVIEKMTIGEKTKIHSEVIGVIQRNSRKNIDELNKKIVSLIQMDEEFKTNLIGSTTVSHAPTDSKT
jgi:hypothetical protein